MAKAEGGGAEKPAKKGGLGCLWRAAIGVIVMGSLLLVGGSLLVRLDGVRRAITERVEGLMGIKLTIGNISVGWPWALVLEDVSTVNYAVGQPGFSAREIRIRTGTRTPWHLAVRRCTLCIVKDGEQWKPEFFAGLGELPSRKIGEVSTLTEPFRRRVSLHISDSSIRWFDRGGREVATVSGLAFDLMPVDIPSRPMYYHAMAIHSGFGVGSSLIQELDREWLAADGEPWHLIHQRGQDLKNEDKSFWEVAQ